jgi:hypothetical protein
LQHLQHLLGQYGEYDAAGCVVELLQATAPAVARRLAAALRCAKATCDAMDTRCLATKGVTAVATPRSRAQRTIVLKLSLAVRTSPTP